MIRIGLVGCGTIGRGVAVFIQREYAGRARVVALHDVQRSPAEALQRRLTPRPAIVPLSTLIRRSDIVVETASIEAAQRLVPQALRGRRSLVVMSTGGLLQHRAWRRLARSPERRVYIPSGALAGLDGVGALAMGPIRRAVLTSRKPPQALAAAPYVRRRGLRLTGLKRPRVLFDGSPQQAIRAFPQNANVAATLALALGPRGRARIRIIADPSLRTNVHELEVEGAAGRLQCRVESRPSANPKTSELAVYSAQLAVRRLLDPVVIGA